MDQQLLVTIKICSFNKWYFLITGEPYAWFWGKYNYSDCRFLTDFKTESIIKISSKIGIKPIESFKAE